MTQEILDAGFKEDEIQGDVNIAKNEAVYIFRNENKDRIAEKLGQYLAGKGYKLEEGAPDRGKYGKGSKIGRILLGAFIKRFCWEIILDQSRENVRLTFRKDAKGYVGGVIGVSQVNTEYDLITNSLKAWHEKIRSK